MPWRPWPSRSRVPSTDFQVYLMDQVISTFPTASKRASDLRYPKPGQMTWLDLPGEFQYWDGALQKWLALGPLRVADRTQLPEVGRVGMTAVDDSGQKWEWRNIVGTWCWTWPKAAQGILWWQGFIGTIPLANPANGAAALSAFDVPPIYVPAGRRVRLDFSGSLTVDSGAPGAYGFVLNFGAPQRRGVVQVPIAGVPQHFEISKPYVSAGPGTYSGGITGGRFAGAGIFSLTDLDGIDQMHQYVITDVGSI